MKSHLIAVMTLVAIVGMTNCTKEKKQAYNNAPDPVEQLKARQELERRRQAALMAEREAFFKTPLKPQLAAAQAFRGPASAKVTIVEYTDFQCPYCSRGANTMKELIKKYGNQVRVTVKHLPLEFHDHAMIAAQYYEAAALQSKAKALELHDLLFAQQAELTKGGETFLKKAAKKVGLNMAKLQKDVKSPKVKAKIESDMKEAAEFKFRGTPSFVVNGVPLKGAYPVSEFSKVIERHLGG